MSQRDDIRAHLQSGASITPLEALSEFGCFRLGARIHELRAEGLPIISETVTLRGKSFARYSMGQA